MWRSQLGSKEVKTITQADDDDWETDPDFVVGHLYFSSIFSVLVALTGVQEQELWIQNYRNGYEQITVGV